MAILGTSITLTANLLSDDTPPVPVDASGAVSCIVQDPTGAETTYVGGDITHVATGVYTVGVFADIEGQWSYRFIVAGQAASEGSFDVTTEFEPVPVVVATLYAQPTDLDTYLGNADYLPNVSAKAALIRQAEADIDLYTANSQNDNVFGRKYTPIVSDDVIAAWQTTYPSLFGVGIPIYDNTIMTVFQTNDLIEACCAQCKFRLTVGTEFFEEPMGQSITGPDYSASNIRRLAPVAMQALMRHNIVHRNARGRAV
jgi:hypothetical protein